MSSNSFSDVSLKHFFIYNDSFGQNEGEEEEKIFYFYPELTDMDLKIKDVGLCQAIVKFASTFSKDNCSVLQTEKTKRFFYQPEENFWIIMTVNLPNYRKGNDGLEGIEYLPNDVQNSVFLSILKQAYLTARLILGPFNHLLKLHDNKPEMLKKKFTSFFTKYILNQNLKNCDILDVFQGVQFLPLDKTTFLHALTILNMIESKLRQIKYSLLLVNEKLTWSGLPAEDIQLIFRYLTSSLIPTLKQKNLINGMENGRFITGLDSDNNFFKSKIPTIYLNHVDKPGFYYLIVYRVNVATVCWFVPDSEIVKIEFFRSLDKLSTDRFNKLCNDIEIYSSSLKLRPGEEFASPVRWIYLNGSNSAFISTVHVTNTLGNKKTLVSIELLRVLVDFHDIHQNLIKKGVISGEVFIKTSSDFWIVGQLSNRREFFVIFDKNKANLKDISSEVKKLSETVLKKSLFFQI